MTNFPVLKNALRILVDFAQERIAKDSAANLDDHQRLDTLLAVCKSNLAETINLSLEDFQLILSYLPGRIAHEEQADFMTLAHRVEAYTGRESTLA